MSCHALRLLAVSSILPLTRRRMRLRMLAIMLLLAAPCPAAQLTLSARQAFENYAAALEKRLAQQHASPDTYLAIFNLGAAQRS